MLEMIFDALVEAGREDRLGGQVSGQVSDQVAALLGVLRGEVGSAALMQALGLSLRTSFRRNYLDPALEGGWIERTQPDSPRSLPQRYRLSERGRRCLKQHGDINEA